MIPKRIVLDTNVCLDLFVFRDPRWDTLLAALKSGAIEAVTRADCRMEWLLVLEYPHLPLNSSSKLQSAAEFDALIACMPVEDATQETSQQAKATLPICRDPDDQKFLELARDARASILITKDKALLKLAKRTARAGMFSIVQPQAWVALQ